MVTFAGRQDLAEVGQVPDEGAAGELAAHPPVRRSMIEFIRGMGTPLRTIRKAGRGDTAGTAPNPGRRALGCGADAMFLQDLPGLYEIFGNHRR